MVQRRSAPLPRSLSDISETQRHTNFQIDNSSATDRAPLAADISADTSGGATLDDSSTASSEVRALQHRQLSQHRSADGSTIYSSSSTSAKTDRAMCARAVSDCMLLCFFRCRHTSLGWMCPLLSCRKGLGDMRAPCCAGSLC